MKFNRDFIERIKLENLIEDVAEEKLSQAGFSMTSTGGGYKCHHHIWNASSDPGQAMWITPNNQTWHCFSCQQGGDVINLAQSFMFGADYDPRNRNQFLEAIKYLADRVNLEYDFNADLDPSYEELRILYSLYADFLQLCIKGANYFHREFLIQTVQKLYPLSEETIYKFKITYFDKEWIQPFFDKLSKKYTKTELFGSGLFYEYKNSIQCVFQNRIIIPYFNSGDVVDLIGRETERSGNICETPDGKLKQSNFDYGGKFKKLPVHSEDKPWVSELRKQDTVFGLDCLKRGEDVIITEGIGDCIVLLQAGFRSISPVTVSFKKEMLEIVSQKLTNVRQVYIANDNEESEAGKKGAKYMHEFFCNKGINTKTIELPRPAGRSKVDVANFFAETDDAKEKFKELIVKAKSFIELEIESLNSNSHQYDVQPVWDKILNLSEYDILTYQEKLAKQIGKSVKKLKETFGSRKAPKSSGKMVFERIKDLNPGLDFIMDYDTNIRHAYLTQYVPFEIQEGDDTVKVEIPYLFHTETDLQGKQTIHAPRDLASDPLTEIEMRRVPSITMRDRWRIDPRYPYSLYHFIHGSPPPKPSLSKIYNEIYKIYDEYVYFSDSSSKVILTLYIMMTYFYPIFNALGYIYLNGSAGTGKTVSAKIASNIAFNSVAMVGVTEANLFRISHTESPTYFIDETEQLQDNTKSERIGPIMQILQSRYKKDAQVSRQAKVRDRMETEYFETFGPTIIACIADIGSALFSRTIKIECVKKTSDKIDIKDYTQNENRIKQKSQGIRDELYFAALLEYHNVMRAYDMLQEDPRIKHVIAREREKWMPLFAMAYAIGLTSPSPNTVLLEQLIEIQKTKQEALKNYEQATNEHLKVLMLLKEILTISGNYSLKVRKLDPEKPTVISVNVYDLFNKMTERMRAASIIQQNDFRSSQYYTGIFRKTQVWQPSEGLPDKTNMVTIDIDALEQAIARFQFA